MRSYANPATAPTVYAVEGTFVHGPQFIDELVQYEPASPGIGDPVGVYYHQDDLFNVTVLSDESGSVYERYEYGDYGAPMTPSLGQLTSTYPVVPFLFNGRFYDHEIHGNDAGEFGWYQYRTRLMAPAVGRFVQRDSVGTWSDAASMGNGIAYVGAAPLARVDPYGYGAAPTGLPIDPMPKTLPDGPPLKFPVPTTAPSMPPIRSFRPTFKPGAGPVGLCIVVGGVAYCTGEAISPLVFPDIDADVGPCPQRKTDKDKDPCHWLYRKKLGACGTSGPPVPGEYHYRPPPFGSTGLRGKPGSKKWCDNLWQRMENLRNCNAARIQYHRCRNRQDGGDKSGYKHRKEIEDGKKDYQELRKLYNDHGCGKKIHRMPKPLW